MDIDLPLTMEAQPDGITCGPTCLNAVYGYFGLNVALADVIASVRKLDAGGTLAVLLGVDALRRGFKATIYSYNLQVFDPTWFAAPHAEIADRLREQARAKSDPKLGQATAGYLEFLELGGRLRFADLTTRLLRSIIRRRLPILTGLSSTYLYRSKRLYGPNDTPDDVRGNPCGHFVVLCGYDRDDRSVRVADPYAPNPIGKGALLYSAAIDRLICAILLGVLTYDANMLVIQPREKQSLGESHETPKPASRTP